MRAQKVMKIDKQEAQISTRILWGMVVFQRYTVYSDVGPTQKASK